MSPIDTSADDDAKGVDFAARTRYAIAFGELDQVVPMDANVAGHVPFWLEAGYRLSPKMLVGLYPTENRQ